MYKGIALSSFIILTGVLFYLTYNTFMLKDKQYQIREKALIKEHYETSIRNDKLYPGGQSVIDGYIMDNIYELETLYRKNHQDFDGLRRKLLDSMFADLRSKNTMDSLFTNIKKNYLFDKELEYLLCIISIKIIFKNAEKVDFYNPNEEHSFIDDSLTSPYGIIIGGNLRNPLEQNLISRITVSTSLDYNYQMTFSLHADKKNRLATIINLMMPTFLLASFSIISVISIYFATYRNWIRQKKLAEMKSDFVNSITHEFHTPISTIMVATKSLQNEHIIADKNQIKTLIQVIERQSMRLQKLFSQVLDITTMDGVSLQKEELELNPLLAEIIHDYRLQVSQENIHIAFLSSDYPCMVALNPFFFTTMICNMLENAIKYNSKDRKQISIETLADDKTTQIVIADNGDGMSGKEISHIFEKFYRKDHNKPNQISGLGLGLFYVHQCIKAHGWQLSVESVEKSGTRFTISIPNKN